MRPSRSAALALAAAALFANVSCSCGAPGLDASPAPRAPSTSERTEEPPAVDSTAEARDRECDPLPAARPSSLSLSATRTVLPHGRPARREAAEIASDREQCERGALCRVVGADVLERVYALAQGRSLHELTWTPARRSPHYGSRYVHVEWSSGRCSVGESSQVALDEPGRQALGAVFDAIVQAYEDAAPP